MRPWEKLIIRELDDIARAIWLKPKKGDKEPNLVSPADTEGVKALFRRLADAKKDAG